MIVKSCILHFLYTQILSYIIRHQNSVRLYTAFNNHVNISSMIRHQNSIRARHMHYINGLSGKSPIVQNSSPLRRPSGARQVLLSSNEFDELRRENLIALSCLIIVLCFFM